QPRVDGVQVGRVRCARPHVETRIAAEDVEAARTHHEAGAGERGRSTPHAAERRARLGQVAVHFEAKVVAEEVAEPATYNEMVVEMDTAIVTRVDAVLC